VGPRLEEAAPFRSPGQLLPDAHDGELSGERPDLVEELDDRSLGLGREPESRTGRLRLSTACDDHRRPAVGQR
jgi:hypothetical protein